MKLAVHSSQGAQSLCSAPSFQLALVCAPHSQTVHSSLRWPPIGSLCPCCGSCCIHQSFVRNRRLPSVRSS